MMLKHAAALLAAGAASMAAAQQTNIEEFEGFTYRLTGPSEVKPKIEYEMDGAHTALHILKTRLGPEGLIDLLQPDIKEADDFWHEVVENSSEDPDTWVAASGRGVVTGLALDAAGFAAWSLSPFSDRASNAANPEHYLRRMIGSENGTVRSEVLEGWGGVTTHFTIEDYGEPDREQWPFLNELPNFPVQAAGGKTLLDGTLFGVLHISVRDVPAEEYGTEEDGIEIYASVWYGDAIDADHLDKESQHIITEIVNLSLQAHKDVESGEFSPPSLPSRP